MTQQFEASDTTGHVAFYTADALGDQQCQVRIYQDGTIYVAEGLSAEGAVRAVWTALAYSLTAMRP